MMMTTFDTIRNLNNAESETNEVNEVNEMEFRVSARWRKAPSLT